MPDIRLVPETLILDAIQIKQLVKVVYILFGLLMDNNQF